MAFVMMRSISQSKFKPLLILVAFFLLFTIYFAPVVLSGQLMAPEDDFKQNLPDFVGEKTLWTQTIYSGFPQAADPLVQTWYPIVNLCELLPMPFAWNIYLILGYALSASFICFFVFELTGSWFGGIVAGVAFSMSGTLLVAVRHPHFTQWIFTLAATLLIIEKLRKSPTAGWTIMGALTMGLMVLNGHVQVLAYTLILIPLYALFRCIDLKQNRIRFVVCVALSIALALAVGMVQLAPTWELAHFSARASFTFADFLTASLHPFQMLGLLLPYLTGSEYVPFFGMRYFGLATRPLVQCYLGLLPLSLILLSTALARKNKHILFWWVVGLLGFLLTFGDMTPLAYWLYHVPPFGMFRSLYRMYYFAAFAGAIISGIVVSLIEKREIHKKYIINTALSVVTLFIIVFYLGTQILNTDTLRHAAEKVGADSFLHAYWQNPSLVCPIIMLVLSLTALYFWQMRPADMIRKAVLLAALILDLGLAGNFCDWHTSAVPLEALQPPSTLAIVKAGLAQSHSRVLATRGGSGTLAELPCNFSKIWNIPNASGYQPLMLTRYGAMLDMTEGGFLIVPWTFKSENRGFDLLSVKYLTCPSDDKRLDEYMDNGHHLFEKIGQSDSTAIYENKRVLARCWLASRVLKLTPEQILSAIRTGRLPDGNVFDPATEALVETEPVAALPSAAADDSALIQTLHNNFVAIKVQCKDKKFLVLSDIYYPGWKATLDGSPASIVRTDYVLRGIEIPPGRHVVEFKFEPLTVLAGAIVSAISLLLLLVASVIFVQRRMQRSKS